MAVGEITINGGDKPKRFVRIPDMFASFMSIEPRTNPHYSKVKRESEEWIAEILRLDEKAARRNSKADFTYLAALWIPDADEEALRVVVDWLHWIFFFDDQFDEGHLQNDYESAKVECNVTFATMEDGHPIVSVEEYPLRWVYQYNWFCFQKRASPGLQQRYKDSMKGYFDAVLGQVNVASESLNLNVDEYMDFRRRSIGVFPTQELIEYAHGIKLPQYVFNAQAITELRRISADMTALGNDMVSYRKDLIQGVEHNVIFIYRRKGLSEQQAVDALGEMVNRLYKEWYRALAEMPTWGEKVDREVLKYCCGCRDIAIGDHYWEFKSGRYLKQDEGDIVRQTRILELPL